MNRAGVALARMKDPTATGPLIDALVTTHKFKLSAGDPGSMSATFNKNPSGGARSAGWEAWASA